ncbi:MAG: ABC transporter permease [Patescibacteria group bacterium]
MRTCYIALKDLKHIFKSVFALVMMFGAPLLITGLIFFAFGGLAGGKGGYNLPVTRIQVVNLDRAGAQAPGFAAGKMLVDFLQDKSLSDVLAVTVAAGEAGARAAVDRRRAGAAVIIPPDFTAAALSPDRTTMVTIYQDPTLTVGPGIVKDLVNHFMDGFSGAKIAGQVVVERLNAPDAQTIQRQRYDTVRQYTAWLKSGEHAGESESSVPPLSIVSPAGESQPRRQGAGLVGPIMAGMIVFFVFFMGANGAESIIREDEQGTLARIFTTPTPLAAVLGGKFLGVVVSLCLQVALLLLASSILFGIEWGQPATVVLVAFGLIVASAGFGVMLMSFIKNSRQTGPVMSGVLTLTGMLGGLFTTGVPNLPAGFNRVTLATPQGWALQGWKLALANAGPGQAFTPTLILILAGLVFLAVGVMLFRKRFA